jgi:isopentenyl phosphate kinase
LKLGGSLITDKNRPMTLRPDIIQRAAAEIAAAVNGHPQLRLLIGHGSGSFGHAVASQYGTQKSVVGPEAWMGFARVWAAARTLNQAVIEALTEVGLPVIAFPPSAGVIARDHQFKTWDIDPLLSALDHQLIPVVQGDVIFDIQTGGTIFSTEKVFAHLAKAHHPARILLAGKDPGVWQDADHPEEIIPEITPEIFETVLPTLSGADTADVTGGMRAKVQSMLDLIREVPNLECRIFSGEKPGTILAALENEPIGTLIRA